MLAALLPFHSLDVCAMKCDIDWAPGFQIIDIAVLQGGGGELGARVTKTGPVLRYVCFFFCACVRRSWQQR